MAGQYGGSGGFPVGSLRGSFPGAALPGAGNVAPPSHPHAHPQLAGLALGAGPTGVGPVGAGPGAYASAAPLQPPLSTLPQQGTLAAGGAPGSAAHTGAGTGTGAGAAAAPPPQNKEFNTASLCRFGQETVQDIVSRTQDVFQTLKAIQPPNGTSVGANASNEKKAKMQEQLRTIRLLFKRLRLIYDKCNENCELPGMEYTHIESLVPVRRAEGEEGAAPDAAEARASDAYRLAAHENHDLTDQVVLKNKQLKEVITNLRTVIWEINVMLTMRRS